ncbi:MAG: CarD family transcriptional regulator [Treponema sp.]|nr:CarD family transcriptional regulator [Treponema sp.]
MTYFAVNEHVVYPIQGVGEIKAIEKRLFREKQVLYYDIYFETPDMTVMVPVENAESIGLRKIVSSKEAAKALELLNKEYEQANTDWKTRNQQNLDLLKKGTISDIAQVVKTLYDRSTSKELPIQERKLFDNASKLLIDEVSLALKKSKKDSESMIFEKLEGGRKPVPEADPELDFDKDLDDDTE